MSYTIKTEQISKSRVNEVDFNNLPFGRVFSDHMFIMEYRNNDWQNPRIVPFHNLNLHPANSALHYGQAIFEGLKAYKDTEGNPQIFRPEMNVARFNRSAERMAMPQVPESLFLEALNQLVGLDSKWIPETELSSLYIRPFMFSNDEYVGIKPADNFVFVIFTSPVGPYYSEPVNVLASDKYVRAFPGGVGMAKAAGNYAATLFAVREAREAGFDQILWMDGANFRQIHEIGTMNVFFQIGERLITPDTGIGCILEGVTRDSVITLLRDWGVEVEIRDVFIDEIINAIESGTLADAFGTGTAASIAPIASLGYQEKRYQLPSIESRVISNRLRETLDGIKTAKLPDLHNWMWKVGKPVVVG